MQTIQEELRDFIAKNILFSPDGFSYEDDASFLDTGIVDSTGIVELVAFTEEHFGISVKDSEITPQNFDSITNLTNYIKNKIQNI
jgi:acyl carrier protein